MSADTTTGAAAAALVAAAFALAGAPLAAVVAFLVVLRCVRFIGKDEQLFIEGLTEACVLDGPKLAVLPLLYKGSRKQKRLALGPLEYQAVNNALDGSRRIEVGPQLMRLRPYDELDGEKQTALHLQATQFVRFLNTESGQVRVEVGEQGKVIPLPHEKFLDAAGVRSAIALKCHEYVKIEDKKTGTIRVERGEKLVYLTGHEEVVGKVQHAIEVDEETAVLVRNKRGGQQHLIVEKQVFVPSCDEEVVEVRKLIKLADHEACIVRGKDGVDEFYFGKNPDQRAFFLPPYSELVLLTWSRGRRRERRDLRIEKLDLRPSFMSFEFNCRTADNVELILEGTFFWEVVDCEKMFRKTGDTPGDVCAHARSRFIERISKVSLAQFMKDINVIAEAVHKDNDSFYAERGVLIHSLEVSGYRCAEASTALILEQIIQETTNRMNRMQQQESENEWQLLQIKGDIEEERAKKELLEVQIANSNARSAMEGQAEAHKIESFLKGLANDVPDLEKRVAMWSVLRKREALSEVCKNGSRLYYTPNDVNLSIEDRSGACVSEASSACKI